jgi:hypothetical protein
MDGHAPPKREDFASDAHWGDARTRYFKHLNRRQRPVPEPTIIEKEVVRVEYVDRIVKVPYEVAGPAPDIQALIDSKAKIDARIKSEPSPAFKRLMLPGEAPAETRARLLPEFDELQSRVANDAATAAQQARHSELHAIQFELKGSR